MIVRQLVFMLRAQVTAAGLKKSQILILTFWNLVSKTKYVQECSLCTVKIKQTFVLWHSQFFSHSYELMNLLFSGQRE